MTDDDHKIQILELEALESVLRENKLTKNSDWTDRNVEIEGIIEVEFDSISDPKVIIELTSDSGEYFSMTLDICPPVRLRFHLPHDYPSRSSPKLEIESDWMSTKQKEYCEAELVKTCNENSTMEVLYICYQAIIDMIEQMQPRVIHLNDAYVLEKNEETIETLRKKVLRKGEEAAEEHFSNTLFLCEVCYDSQMGQRCIKFQPCNHVFCKSCTFDYYRSLAKGVVSKQMQCLAEKCQSEAQQSVIKEALGNELYAKYEDAMLEKAIRDMDDAVECPRESCQKVAYITDRKMYLAECSYCNFSFCNLCKQTFHGISGCKKDDKEKWVQQWQEGDELTKAKICRQFGGEKNIEIIVEQFLNEKWLNLNSKPCPKCSVSIEKSQGCNKVHCTKCDTYFCWLCCKVLGKEEPYKHFQGNEECSGRLFEGLENVVNEEFEELFDIDDMDLEQSDYESDESDLDIEEWLEQEGHFDYGPEADQDDVN